MPSTVQVKPCVKQDCTHTRLHQVAKGLNQPVNMRAQWGFIFQRFSKKNDWTIFFTAQGRGEKQSTPVLLDIYKCFSKRNDWTIFLTAQERSNQPQYYLIYTNASMYTIRTQFTWLTFLFSSPNLFAFLLDNKLSFKQGGAMMQETT